MNNKFDDLLYDFGDRKCMSMGEYENDREDDPRDILSYPNTPTGYREEDADFTQMREFKPPDNVYAEVKIPKPKNEKGE